MDERKRDQTTTELPTLDKEKSADRNDLEILKIIYGEANSNYRNLADIRFKLLGFLPALSVLAWIELYKKVPADRLPDILLGLLVTMLGMRITYGIRIYDSRNDEIYNDIVSRGRKIEEEFGVHTALFKGRLKANKRDVFRLPINHGRATSMIYSSVFIGWFLLLSWYLISWIRFF
jgi:hypothetical protein